MTVRKFIQKSLFRLRGGIGFHSFLRKTWWRVQGVQIGQGTSLCRIEVNWPHQISIGEDCVLEPDIAFKFDSFWQPGPQIVIGNKVFLGRHCEFNICERIEIGNDCLIASGCRFIDHNHGTVPSTPMNVQPCTSTPIVIEDDVWIGVNSVILKGVRIGKGSIVGAGAVVTKSIGPREIWAGVPARQIGTR